MSARTVAAAEPTRSQVHRHRGRWFVSFVVPVALLVMVSIGSSQTAGAVPGVLPPSLKVGPSANLIGNRVAHITGQHWPSSDATVRVELCSSSPFQPNASCGDIGYPTTSKSGSWSLDYALVNPQAPVGCIEGPIVCYIEATDNGAITLTENLTFKPLTVFLTPDEYGDGYYWFQKVAVHVTGFPSGDPVNVEVCDSSGDCDPSTSATIMTNGGGSGAVHDYLLNENVCSEHGDCAVIATDPAYSSYPQDVVAVYDFEGYCGPIVCDGFGPDNKSPVKVN
jgi:hypothetical protein